MFAGMPSASNSRDTESTCTIFLVDMKEWQRGNKIRQGSSLEVANLGKKKTEAINLPNSGICKRPALRIYISFQISPVPPSFPKPEKESMGTGSGRERQNMKKDA